MVGLLPRRVKHGVDILFEASAEHGACQSSGQDDRVEVVPERPASVVPVVARRAILRQTGLQREQQQPQTVAELLGHALGELSDTRIVGREPF